MGSYERTERYNVVARNVKLLSQQNFDKMVFKEKLEQYHEFIKSKLAESENYI